VRADPTLPPLFTRGDALAAGMSRHQVAQRIRAGRWRTLRRAIYVTEQRYAALTAREQHATAVVAALMTRADGAVASHLSAALAYGWVPPLGGAGPVTLTDGDLETPTRRWADLVVQVASLPPTDVRSLTMSAAGTRWQVQTTSRSRTVADCLRHLPNPDGVALADSALREPGVSYEGIAAVLRQQSGWPYAANAQRALPPVDPRRESWLESYSFVTLHQLGLPMPEPQVSLFDGQGRLVGRVDGRLEDEAVALESDGQGKYVLGEDNQPLPADLDLAADALLDRARRRVMQEKERRDRIADLGAELARWGTREIVGSPREVLARVAAARRRGDARRFTGRAAYLPAPSWLQPARRRAS
jgi:hypothetical protein